MTLSHRCINFRHGSGGVYRWELDKDDQSLAVSVNGPLILDDLDLVIRAAIEGARLGVLGGGSRGAARRNRGAQARPRDERENGSKARER